MDDEEPMVCISDGRRACYVPLKVWEKIDAHQSMPNRPQRLEFNASNGCEYRRHVAPDAVLAADGAGIKWQRMRPA